MRTDYIRAAMRKAHYEIIEDPNPYFGSIGGCRGVWATGPTLEACRKELQSVLEDWIVLGFRLGHPLPAIEVISVGQEKLEVVDA